MVRALAVITLVLVANLAQSPAHAVDVFAFKNPEHAQRYSDLAARLRCPKCLNTNLEGSDAPIAQDLKQEIYEQIQSGRSDAEILDFMRARYGDFILYEPRLTSSTWLLWFGPLLMIVAGFCILWWRLRGAPTSEVTNR